jgi:pimeloyl-ACP methyl ester carboxylesterase
MQKGDKAMNLPAMQLTEIKGVKLEIWDSGSGEPVVFVHGSMGDECFAMLAEPALTNRYRLIHYHRRGWGKSALPEAPVSISQQAVDCRAVMQHLGVERAHLVGQSYGSVILLQMALDAPELVRSLALLEPALPSVLFNSPAVGEVMAKSTSLYESGDKAGAMDTFGREVAGADFRTVFDQTLPPGNFERWVAAADTFFQSDLPALQPWQFTREDAARITQPVLNMMGANTRSYFQEVYETVRTWLPHAKNFVLPSATHAMLQTNPKGAAERLAGFFSRHRLHG